MHVRVRRPGGWGDVRLPDLRDAPEPVDRCEVEGGEVRATREGWQLLQDGKVVHDVMTDRIRAEVWTALGGRVFAVGVAAYGVREGQAFPLDGIAPTILFDQDGRVFASRDGTHEVVHLEEAWAAGGEPLPPELDLRSLSFAKDPEAFRAAIEDPQVRDARVRGTSRLSSEAAKGNVEAVKALLEAGADPGSTNADGTPAAYSALFTDSVETVEALYEAGFRFESDVEWSLNAVYAQKPEMVRWCIGRGLVDERVLHYARQAKAHWKDPSSKGAIVAMLEEAVLAPFDRGDPPEDPELRTVFDAAPYSQDWWYALLSLGKRLEETTVRELFGRVLADPGAAMTSMQQFNRGHVVDAVMKNLGPEATYETLAPGEVKTIALAARREQLGTPLAIDPRWIAPMLDFLVEHPEDGVVGGVVRGFPPQVLRKHADRLAELGRFGALEIAEPDHPVLAAHRREELAMPEEPDGVARAAAYFADDESMRAEVLRQTVEALDHCDDDEQIRPHVETVRKHELDSTLVSRISEIARRYREGLTGHVVEPKLRKKIVATLEALCE